MKYVCVLAAAVLPSLWAQTGPSGSATQPGGTQAQQSTQNSRIARRTNDIEVPFGQLQYRGILIDAGCRDRATLNLRRPPETLAGEAPAQPANAKQNNPPLNGAVSANGISVNGSTIQAERTGVMEEHVPEMFERQADPTCAITASTTNFALLTDDGKLLDLDQGGNTLASIAVLSTAGGRALVNGQGPGIKPHVWVKGQIRGDRLVAQDMRTGS